MDGLVGVPYYADSAIDISFDYPADPDEAIGDEVTCYAEIDDDPSFATPIMREVAAPGVLAFTPASPAEYFTCATPYQVRVRCVDTCGNITASTTTRTFETGPTVEWTRTYNGTGDGYDAGNGIAVNIDGNIIVIGTTTQTGSDSDIWIRAYDIDGNAIWTQTHNGPWNLSDHGNDVAVDRSGNIYAIGSIADIPPPMSSDWDIWMSRYSSDGTRRWTDYYDSPGSTTLDTDEGRGIAIDNSTGSLFGVGLISPSSAEMIFWLGKYRSSDAMPYGTISDSTLGEGSDVAVDNSGNVYVVGSVEGAGERDLFVRRYDGSMTAIWTRTYNGRYSGRDFGRGIAVDDTGNVYVTGSEQATSSSSQPWLGRYDADGNLIWDQIAGGSGVATNILGSVYSTGARISTSPVTSIISSTSRINPETGEIICAVTESADIESRALSADDFGNVYLTGNQTVPGEDYNIWVRRYSGF
jgi:hypothetical protein